MARKKTVSVDANLTGPESLPAETAPQGAQPPTPPAPPQPTAPGADDDDFGAELDGAGEGVTAYPAGQLPPDDGDDFFSPESFAIAAQMAPAPVSSVFAIEERRPPKDQYIRISTQPGQSAVWPTITCASASGADDKITYVLHPRLARELETDPAISTSIVPARIMLCHTLGGSFFLWVVNQPNNGDRESSMTIARRQAILLAESHYTRITWNQQTRTHDAFPFRGQAPEIVWPDKPFAELIKIAFGSPRMIRDRNHPVIRRLAGLEA